MKFKVTGPDQKVFDKMLNEFQERIDKQIFTAFQAVALQAVTDARNKEPNDSYREAVNSMSHARGIARATIGPDTPGFNDRPQG